jgi:hypothetical protein
VRLPNAGKRDSFSLFTEAREALHLETMARCYFKRKKMIQDTMNVDLGNEKHDSTDYKLN